MTQNISSGTEFPQTEGYDRALNIHRKKLICVPHYDVLYNISTEKLNIIYTIK